MTITLIKFDTKNNRLLAQSGGVILVSNTPLTVWLKKLSHNEVIHMLIDAKPAINQKYWTLVNDLSSKPELALNVWN